MIIKMMEKKLSNSYFSSPAHIYVNLWILYPSARESKISKPIQLYARRQS